MRIKERIEINDYSGCKIIFFRIDPEDKRGTIRKILEEISDMSWINRILPEELIESMKARVIPTVEKLNESLSENDGSELTSKIGEYFVSELARETLINQLGYSDIPLAELRKEKILGNPGFDYHSESDSNIIIFGEAKYVANKNAYSRALKQVIDFINDKKDEKELVELTHFVSLQAIKNANLNRKGYAIGFSSCNTNTQTLINNIKNNDDFKALTKYEEMVIVAVDVNG